MKIQTFIYGVVQTNCYIVSNEKTSEAILIDPADNAENIKNTLKEQNLNPVAILLTHGHFDHMMAAPELSAHYKIDIYVSENEKDLIRDPKMNAAFLIRNNLTVIPNKYFHHNESLTFIDKNIRVIHTPGHTAGSTCFYFEDEGVLISGDTLFYESIGRTDLPTGNSSEILKSIQENLLWLPDEVVVYPGHGDKTTIGHEKRNNPYLSASNLWD
jgi:hydroxyacylglutathione hydrolase